MSSHNKVFFIILATQMIFTLINVFYCAIRSKDHFRAVNYTIMGVSMVALVINIIVNPA